MLKNIVKIQYNSDFTLNCKLPNGYDGQDFIIRLYTTDKASYFEASYLNGEYSNCLTDDDNKNVVVYVNNHGLQPGCLHVGLQIDYDNTHFADNVENIITAEETNVYLVKQNANATSAMYVGSALPDLTGSSDFITQSDLEFELLNYYTKEDIDNASYISSADLNDFVTEEELNDMGFLSQSQLDAMGYATVSYVDTKTSQKQDRLINGVNIKTVNGYSLLGNGDLVIEGGGSAIDMSAYVTHTFLQNQAYVTSSQLNNASYATQSFVDDAVADAITEIDVPTYTSDLTNDSGFITASDLNGYATETYVSDYVAQHAPTPDLSAYVTKTELSNMGYITSIPAEYVTESEISSMGYATESYVENYVATHSGPIDLSAYVSKDELNQMGYITSSDVSQMGYVTSSDLSNMGYITSIPSEYVTETEIAGMGYVTTTELSNAGYITSIPSEYVTESELSAKGYITSIPAEYVTQSELSNMGYITSIPSEYVTETEIAGMGYVTSTELSNIGYITMSDVSVCGYVTESQLQQAGYITSSDIPTIPTIDESIIPNTTNTYTLGNGSYFYNAAYANELYVNGNSKVYNENGGVGVKIGNNSAFRFGTTALYPVVNNSKTLGVNSNQFSHIYSANFIENGTNINDKYATKVELPKIDESIIPNTTNTYTLGDSSHIYKSTYTSKLYLGSNITISPESNAQTGSDITININNEQKFYLNSNRFAPNGSSNNKAINLGTSDRMWRYTYSAYFIEDGTNIKDIYTQTEVVTQDQYDALTTEQKNSETIYVISDQQAYFDNELVTEQSLSAKGYLTADNFQYDPTTGTLTLIL